MKAINNNEVFCEIEVLDHIAKYHDYIMTTLRTIWGTDERHIMNKFGKKIHDHFIESAASFIGSDDLVQKDGIFYLTERGMLISDFIIKKLFI